MVIGGYDGAAVTENIEMLDSTSNVTSDFETLTSMSTSRNAPATVVVGRKVYIIGGSKQVWGTSGLLSSMEILDTESNVMSNGVSISTARYFFSGVQVTHNVMCVCGGWEAGGYVKTTECYDFTEGIWAIKADMNAIRWNHGVASLNGKMYACAGASTSTKLKTCERFDFGLNTWENIAPLSLERDGVAGATMGEYIYMAGGYTGSADVKIVERYSEALNTWQLIGNMVKAKRGSGMAVWNNKIAVAGGYFLGPLDTLEIYDAEAQVGVWSESASKLKKARWYHKVVAV